MPRGLAVPHGDGGGTHDPFFVRYYVDDAIVVKVQRFEYGDRCLQASASLASVHFRLFGDSQDGEPPSCRPAKFPRWDTRLEVLGWDINTVEMTTSLPPAKLERLRELLCQWPFDRTSASESEVQSLMGRLLPTCEVLRPDMFFVQRMVNQLGLPPSKHEKYKMSDL